MITELYKTKEVKFFHYGYSSYFIELKKENGFWFQRHTFIDVDGDENIEDWILISKPFMIEKQNLKNLIKGIK